MKRRIEPADKFQLSLDEKCVSRHASLDQALQALKELTVPKFSTGYVDRIDEKGLPTETIYTKEKGTITRHESPAPVVGADVLVHAAGEEQIGTGDGWAEEVALCQQGQSTCGNCGEVVDQSKGFANAEHGFRCFDCHHGGDFPITDPAPAAPEVKPADMPAGSDNVVGVPLVAKFDHKYEVSKFRGEGQGTHTFFHFFTDQNVYKYSMGNMRVDSVDGSARLFNCDRREIGFDLGHPRDERYTFPNAAAALAFYRKEYEAALGRYFTRKAELIRMAEESVYHNQVVVTDPRYSSMIMKVEETEKYLGDMNEVIRTTGCIEIEVSIPVAMVFLLDPRFCAEVVECVGTFDFTGGKETRRYWSNWLFTGYSSTLHLKHGSSRDGSSFAFCKVDDNNPRFGKNAR